MAPVFIFAELVRSLVRSGKNEIEIPEGARISSAAADLIKEYKLQVKTVAPGKIAAEKSSKGNEKSKMPTSKTIGEKSAESFTEKDQPNASPEASVELSEDELEEIANRVLERFKQLKGSSEQQTITAISEKIPTKEETKPEDDDLIICRCEEITRGEIKEAIKNGMRTLNGIKRVTRAGMGLCQGQTCQQLVARIITEELGLSAAAIDPTTARGPVRPLRLEVFANS